VAEERRSSPDLARPAESTSSVVTAFTSIAGWRKWTPDTIAEPDTLRIGREEREHRVALRLVGLGSRVLPDSTPKPTPWIGPPKTKLLRASLAALSSSLPHRPLSARV
jgi:hypothetical protein